MISREEKVECPWCGETKTLGEWNDNTYKRCTSREMRRAFTPLTQERAFTRKADTFYLCVNCNRWSRGSQLKIVNTDDKKLLKLGGEPLVSTPERE